MEVQIDIVFLFSLDMYLEVELLDHVVVLFLIFRGTSILFFIVAAPVYIPINSAGEFPFLYSLSSIYPLIFDNDHSDLCEVILH